MTLACNTKSLVRCVRSIMNTYAVIFSYVQSNYIKGVCFPVSVEVK